MNDCMVIAHRGAHRNAPPNTMPAFAAAEKLGCDSVETDVHFTKDNELVICHNPTINKTSDGRGAIRSMTLEKLFNYDFGSYFSLDYAGTKIPTLHEFAQYMKDTSIRLINVEIKPVREKCSEVVKKTIEEAKQSGVFDRLLISSFDPKVLIEAKKVDCGCKTAYIYPSIGEIARRWLFPPIRKAKKMGVDYIHPHANYVSRAIVSVAHRSGMKVSVWTVNKTAQMKRMLRDGVDGIITDDPEELQRILDKYAK